MTKSKRATIHIAAETSEAFGLTQKGELSGRIAAIAARYERIVRDVMPALSKPQWCAIFDANNGADAFAADGVSPTIVWANVHDSPGLGEKWSIDQDELVRELQSLTVAELLSIQEACARFWQHADDDTDNAILHSWARIQ